MREWTEWCILDTESEKEMKRESEIENFLSHPLSGGIMATLILGPKTRLIPEGET